MNTVKHIIMMFVLLLLWSTAQAEERIVFYHNDIMGSPVAATDESGNVLWREDYAPYGKKLGDDMEAAVEKVGYTGHRYDMETGLVYAGARMYDPALARFMGIDPVSAMASVDQPFLFNRYAYANNNPYRYVDPDGQIPIDTVWDAASIIYDVGKIGVGFATGNDQLVKEGGIDLAVDTAALFIPYVPAGSTKLARRAAEKASDLAKVCCFVAGTKVLTKDGYKNIEDIGLDELLYAKNVETGEQAYKPVTHLFKKNRLIYELTVVSESGEEDLIKTTDDHPFYVKARGGFIDTIDLLADDIIETEDQGVVRVKSVVNSGRYDVTYNFEVADFHTYYVTKLNLLVHNCSIVSKEAADAAKRLGVNLDKISVTNGVGRAKIDLSSNLDPGDINKLKDVFKARGASKAEIDTGFIANEKLDAFLRRRVQDGKPFNGGTVRNSTSKDSDFTIDFDL